MKRISFFIILFCITLGSSMSISSAAAPIVGTAVGENAGNLIFDYETGVPGTNEVSINANTLIFAGTFWTENAGWCTFNGLGAKLIVAVNDMSMTGFAWCENAGWISFAPRGAINTSTYLNSDVFFDKNAGLFHGFAWSENLGWINMEGLITDITAPELPVNFKPFSANGSKSFTLSDPSPVAPGIGLYEFKVENWNDASLTTTGSSAPTFVHDFRQAKQYYLKITDPFGNSSEGNIQVVADVPSDVFSANPITGATAASAYSSTFGTSIVADASAVHTMEVKLRDQYGNPVKNESFGGVSIKTVKVRVAFNNNVDTDQRDITLGGNLDLGDAIKFPSTIFGGLTYLSGAVGTASNASGDYALAISSYAPTKAGYAFTTSGNDISLQKLSYEVIRDPSVTGVGEVSEQNKLVNMPVTGNLKFSPALYIGTVSNTDNWSIRAGYDTNFSATLLTGTTVSLSSPKVAHILDINSNMLISYQNPSNITGGAKDCEGYMKTISTFNGLYTFSNALCNRPDSSNILMTPSTLGSTMGFSWKPTIIYAAPTNSVVKYTSEISYDNAGVPLKYPSYSRSNNSVSLADGTATATTDIGVGVINQSVKILGMTNARNTIDVLQGNTTNKVGSLTRVDIKNAIHKNVEIMTRGGVPSSAKYAVYAGATISDASWPAGKDTIIVKGSDLTIDGNITNSSSSIKGIIVLKNDAGQGGNIYIKKNVFNIAAVLFADKSIISGELSPLKYYSDTPPITQTATGQLFLKGSIISDNTIGGASMTPLKCPYGAGSCTDQEAKRYDLNYFRFYTGTNSSSPGSAALVPSGGFGYPFVIEYDTRIQIAPPPGFSMAQ